MYFCFASIEQEPRVEKYMNVSDSIFACLASTEISSSWAVVLQTIQEINPGKMVSSHTSDPCGGLELHC